VIKFTEKDHDVVVFDGARSDCVWLCLFEDPRLVNEEDDKAIHIKRRRFSDEFTSISLNLSSLLPLLVVPLTLIYNLSVITT
jgi:hypothetical protein